MVRTARIFLACPIGADGSEERLRSDRLLKHVIYPVVKELISGPPEETVVRADKLSEPGRITTQILRELAESSVVIADVTNTNPNVMYELGIRQALLKPFVLMAEAGQKLPFDLTDLRTVFYELDLDHVSVAQDNLKQHLQKAMEGAVSSLDQALFQKSVGSGETQTGTPSRDFLAVLEVCENVLKEMHATKELVAAVGGIALEIKESKENKEEQERLRQEKANQEMGMFMMSQLLQNPDSAEKFLPVMQKLAEIGNAPKSLPSESTNSNRSSQKSRRK